MTRSEVKIQRSILGHVGSRPWCRLWRQNVGLFIALSDGVPPPGTDLFVPAGRWRIVKTGVPGAADLSGILRDGRRLEIEVKSARGRQTKAQRAFQSVITSMGGIYIISRSSDEAVEQLREAGYGDGGHDT